MFEFPHFVTMNYKMGELKSVMVLRLLYVWFIIGAK